MALLPSLNFSPIIVLGLTGRIASGKSTCAALLRNLGIKTIDADRLVHNAYSPGTDCYIKLKNLFGDSIISTDKSIDRVALGKIVFANKIKMKQLTDIVWPATKKLLLDQIKIFHQIALKEKSACSVVILEAAVLLKTDWISIVDGILLVETLDDSIIAERLRNRHPGISDIEIEERIGAQTTYSSALKILQELQLPYKIINTACSIETMQKKFLEKYLELVKNIKTL